MLPHSAVNLRSDSLMNSRCFEIEIERQSSIGGRFVLLLKNFLRKFSDEVDIECALSQKIGLRLPSMFLISVACGCVTLQTEQQTCDQEVAG